MSTKATQTADTKGKKRHNVAFSDESRQRGETLASMEKRSFNNLLEVLIDREWFRLGLEKKKQNQKRRGKPGDEQAVAA